MALKNVAIYCAQDVGKHRRCLCCFLYAFSFFSGGEVLPQSSVSTACSALFHAIVFDHSEKRFLCDRRYLTACSALFEESAPYLQ